MPNSASSNSLMSAPLLNFKMETCSVHQNTASCCFGKEISSNQWWASTLKGLAMPATSNSLGITTRKSSLQVPMGTSGSGTPNRSIRDSPIKNSTSTSSLKRKSTSNQKIRPLLISTGYKLKMITGLSKMPWVPCGNIILILIKETSSLPSTQAGSMISQFLP